MYGDIGMRVHECIKSQWLALFFVMHAVTRSKNIVLSQLSALRRAIDDERRCPKPKFSRIYFWENQYAECAIELAHIEVRAWRMKQPFA